MAEQSLAHPRTPTSTRAERGLALYRDKRGAFERISRERETYVIPSCSSHAEYQVSLATGECECPDHQNNGAFCKHLWAALYYRRWVQGTTNRMFDCLGSEADK